MSGAADEIARRMEAAAMGTLGLIGLDLQGEAQRHAPIEEGTLRGSADSRVEKTADGGRVVVSFSTPYAAIQEREESYLHPRGGEAHYLGNALKSRVPIYVRELQAAISRALRGL